MVSRVRCRHGPPIAAMWHRILRAARQCPGSPGATVISLGARDFDLPRAYSYPDMCHACSPTLLDDVARGN